MTDAELLAHFGIGERALRRLRMTGMFPRNDELISKTDSKAVDHYFDQRAGLAPSQLLTDGPENFD